jgi:hypothetical protein
VRVLFCGDRNWTDRKKIASEIKKLSHDDLVIEGDANGADKLAGRLALYYGIPLAVFPAPWEYHGRAAGPIRNGWMLKYGSPDKVIAFHPDIANSKGTLDMVKRAKKAGIPVEVIE